MPSVQAPTQIAFLSCTWPTTSGWVATGQQKPVLDKAIQKAGPASRSSAPDPESLHCPEGMNGAVLCFGNVNEAIPRVPARALISAWLARARPGTRASSVGRPNRTQGCRFARSEPREHPRSASASLSVIATPRTRGRRARRPISPDFSSRETPARKAVPSPNARKAVPAPRRRARPTAGPSRRCGPRGQLGGRSRVTQTPSRRPSIKLCACSDNLPLPPSLPLPPRLAPPCPHRASGRA